MRALIQRVAHAAVTVDGAVTGQIEKGYLVLLGVTESDTDSEVTLLADKLLKLRLFPDAEGKTNCSITDVGGALLVISQFTLCADCRKGTRPSFSHAAKPDEANRLYELFLSRCRAVIPHVNCGVFGAHMDVDLRNDGPFTVMLDTDDLKRPRSGNSAV
ncbi:MAG: D-tyrosyl-tRNA(Tyr) deacylase [Oscillospiraceae bacterium]|nr:D-tyrosyl-tRNA(Tyr) deacylase [Oscillospiraceae bacterium]